MLLPSIDIRTNLLFSNFLQYLQRFMTSPVKIHSDSFFFSARQIIIVYDKCLS